MHIIHSLKLLLRVSDWDNDSLVEFNATKSQPCLLASQSPIFPKCTRFTYNNITYEDNNNINLMRI